jgi:aerobic C4-dicarboxylate transport protein
MFVSLIKMMRLSSARSCWGVGSLRKAATGGKVGGLAFVYFLVMSTVALGIGLVVGPVPQVGLEATLGGF